MPREFKERPTGGYWNNDEPITDIHEALDLLRSDTSSVDPIHLSLCFREDVKWEVAMPWYREGSSGADSSGTNYFQIDQELADHLRAEGFVQKRQIPRWGYTETVDDEFTITDLGKDKIENFIEEMREKAKSLLVPGVHTDLTGDIVGRGYGRDHWKYGPLYFQFVMPEEQGLCRVYPEEERIELPPKETAEAA